MSRQMVYNVQSDDDEQVEQNEQMSKRDKKKFKLKFTKPKGRTGPYDFQSKEKCQMDNRPKRRRTRKNDFEAFLREHDDDGV